MENPILNYVKEYLNKTLKEKNNQKPEVAKFIKDHIMAAYDEYRDQGNQPDEIASVIDDMVSKNLLNDETFVDKLFDSTVLQEELNNLPAGLYREIMKDEKIPFIKKDSYFDKILQTDEVKDWQQDRTQPNYLKDL
ncbi:MAG: hypothetical protein J5598_02090, partial [Clostridia bacterium]|nr:hypothetical protein [Clostridia bacterium]